MASTEGVATTTGLIGLAGAGTGGFDLTGVTACTTFGPRMGSAGLASSAAIGFSASINAGEDTVADEDATDSAGMPAGAAGADGAGDSGDASVGMAIGGGAVASGVEEGTASGRGALAQPERIASTQAATQIFVIVMISPD